MQLHFLAIVVNVVGVVIVVTVVGSVGILDIFKVSLESPAIVVFGGVGRGPFSVGGVVVWVGPAVRCFLLLRLGLKDGGTCRHT